MTDIETYAPSQAAGPNAGAGPRVLRKMAIALSLLSLGLGVYQWLAGKPQMSRFAHPRSIVLAVAILAVSGASTARRPLVRRVLLAVNFLLILAFWVMFLSR